MKGLLIEDTLLYIAAALIAFGLGILEASFAKGIISLVVAAILVIIRGYLKKQNILKREKKLLQRMSNIKQ